ncbi:MAG: SRPBCC family protein [Pseudomonadota bacterium]
MKFSDREDIALPIETVFAAVSDFGAFERRALRRGAEISRTDPESGPGLGTVWDVEFEFRGRARSLKAKVTDFTAPTNLLVSSLSGGLKGSFSVKLVALSPRKTRLTVGLELVPTNLSARLLVQSLKLAKSSLSKRFDQAVADYAAALEREHGAQPPRAANS